MLAYLPTLQACDHTHTHTHTHPISSPNPQRDQRSDLSSLFSDLLLSPALSLSVPQGNYIDKKCPFTGNVSIRGRILKGLVISTKMKRTIVMRRDYLHYIRKYRRYEKRHTNISVHCSPCFKGVKEGDVVTAGQCRPLSKTVRFNVLKVDPISASKPVNVKKQFRVF